MIVHLNGWPGIGKRTIGRVLAERLGARFVHNHVLHDVAIACAGIDDAARWPLYEQVRCRAQGGIEQEHRRRRREAEPASMTTQDTVLRGADIVLRRPRSQDVAARFALGRDAGIMRMFGADATGWSPLTRADAARWVERLAAHPQAWVVEHEGHFLGEVRLDGLDLHDARARLAIGLYDPARPGMGLGWEAIRLVLAHAFGPLRLHRVGLRVIAYNVRAIRCYQACGFIVEGREREAALVGGTRHDDIMMGILAHEFVAAAQGAGSA